MAFGGKPFDSIEPEDIVALLTNQVAESKTLDYKIELAGRSDGDKKEFLADVSSFANTAGGFIVHGVKESGGIPVEIAGLGDIDAEAEILRLESIIRDGLEPRLPRLATRVVVLPGGATVLLLHIPRSWLSPHMVTFKNSSRFYSRHSSGKYQLDVSEIRTAFADSESGAEHLRDFRLKRVNDVLARQIPLSLPETATILLHVLPISAVRSEARTADLLPTVPDLSPLRLLYGTAVALQWHNFDGVVAVSGAQHPASYLQIFRNGTVEAADTRILEEHDYRSQWVPVSSEPQPSQHRRRIPPLDFEKRVIRTVGSILRFQRALGVEPPVVFMLNLLRVCDYFIIVDEHFFESEVHPIDRDLLLVPDLMIESLELDAHGVAGVLRPAFDAIWNAAGHARSLNYDESGNWCRDFTV